jgi:hypothetical protein
MLKKNCFTYRLESGDRYARGRTVISHIPLLSCARPARVEALLELLLFGGLLFRHRVRQLVTKLLLQLTPTSRLDTLRNKGISVLRPCYNFIVQCHIKFFENTEIFQFGNIKGTGIFKKFFSLIKFILFFFPTTGIEPKTAKSFRR